MLTVAKLISILQSVENKDMPLYFTYDSRVCCLQINCVDLVPDGNIDQRAFAAQFMEGYKEPEPMQAIVFRSEDKHEYDYHSPRITEEEFRKECKEKYDRMLTDPNNWAFRLYNERVQEDPDYIAKEIEKDVKRFNRNKKETENDINLFFEGE